MTAAAKPTPQPKSPPQPQPKQKLEINWSYVLMLGAPIAIAGELLHWPAIVIFASACAALIPLAGLIGESTEMLAERTGPKIGGLLNATLGNAAELIITIVALREGLNELVKASITGSILGNLLLVLGFSLVFGGLKNGKQKFNRVVAGQNANMLLLAIIALAIPSLFSTAIGPDTSFQVEALSIGVAISMILIYGLGIAYSFLNPANDTALTRPSVEHKHTEKVWSLQKSIGVMVVAVIGVVILSEFLVGTVEPILEQFPFISEFFLGIVLIPIIGNVAEHIVAVQVAIKNDMELSMEIAAGSSLQIALFVAPVLVFISLLFPGPHLTMHFNEFELIALMVASVITAFVSMDGETNWLEGAQLLVVYVILGLAFFFLPAG